MSDRAPVAYGPGGAIFFRWCLVAGTCFTSYEDQIEILKSRILIIPDHQKAFGGG